ncbi:MAG: NADH dehydrogenase [Spirochaetes bacterium RBG_16_67_19]|nr:MAG: NADH dehydrogenase [Spirochaetes bacterium RBG_16_67_19]
MNTIYIGMGTCGLAVGAAKVRDAVGRWAEARGRQVQITPTGCVGYCVAEPILDVVTDEGYRLSYGNVTPEEAGFILDEVLVRGKYKVDGLLGQYRNSKTPLPGLPLLEEHPFFKKQVKFVLRNCGVINPESVADYRRSGGFQGLEKALALGPEGIIQELLAAGLRGRGGAGFPTGKKWQFAQVQKAERKFVICNADEGDPGAFMDRSLLEGDPFSLLEGLIIAGYAIGAREGVIYCRAEYPLAIKRLERAIELAKAEGLLGKPLTDGGFSFSLKVKQGAGAFVCGEETALMASIEGRRGMPRPRPPFPAVSGLFGCPTIINNVETFCNVPHLLREGAAAFAAMGTATSKGTKVFALTGKVKNSGLVEVPMGTTLREIIFEVGGGIPGGKAFKAVQSGGPSGGCVPAQLLDTRIDYESLKAVGAMMGSGGLVVMDEDTCMVDVAKYFLAFTTKESCGKCIPCREGTRRMFEILESITQPYSQMKNEEENLLRFNRVLALENLATVIKETSLCGLGQSAPNPVLSTLKYFREEYEAHIYDRKCPAAQCRGLLTYHIDTEACRGCTVCAKKCPTGAIVGESKKAHYILDDKCVRCGSCHEACRFDAVLVA